MTTNNTTSNEFKINHAAYAGKLNEQDTVAKFTREHHVWREMQEKDQGKILTCLEEIFAGANPNGSMNKPAVVTLTLGKIGFTTDTYNSLRERVETVIDNNPRYYTVKGKGGGLRRCDDEQLATFEETGKYPDQIEREAKETKAEEKKTGKK